MFITPAGPEELTLPAMSPEQRNYSFYRQCMTPDFSGQWGLNRLVQTRGLTHSRTVVRMQQRGMPDLYTNKHG